MSEPPQPWDWEEMITQTMAAGISYEGFWLSTPYEWWLHREGFRKRCQAYECIAVWHAHKTLTPYRKGGGTMPPPPFSKGL